LRFSPVSCTTRAMLTEIRSGRAIPGGLALALIACALFLRILVPQGWMPVASHHGWQLAPCSGAGPVASAAPMAGGAHHGHTKSPPAGHDGSAESPCVYAGLTQALDSWAGADIRLPQAAPAALAAATVAATAVSGKLAAPPPPSTGPPLG
jgi:hypothetical protein